MGGFSWRECSVRNEMTALLIASAMASVFAEILARIVKSPGTVLLMPMLIPLIPGGNLYYTMFNMVKVTQRRSNPTYSSF